MLVCVGLRGCVREDELVPTTRIYHRSLKRRRAESRLVEWVRFTGDGTSSKVKSRAKAAVMHPLGENSLKDS